MVMHTCKQEPPNIVRITFLSFHITTSLNSVTAWGTGSAPLFHFLVEMLRKIVIFGLAGTIATSAHFLTLILRVEASDIAPVLATSAGSMVGAPVNYLLNYRYTFRSTKAHLDAGPKFFSIALMTGLLNAVLVIWAWICWTGITCRYKSVPPSPSSWPTSC